MTTSVTGNLAFPAIPASPNPLARDVGGYAKLRRGAGRRTPSSFSSSRRTSAGAFAGTH